jgi:hypothetical protein
VDADESVLAKPEDMPRLKSFTLKCPPACEEKL